MAHVKIPFQQRFRLPLQRGIKTQTARTKRMGEPGDTFTAYGHTFTISTSSSAAGAASLSWRQPK